MSSFPNTSSKETRLKKIENLIFSQIRDILSDEGDNSLPNIETVNFSKDNESLDFNPNVGFTLSANPVKTIIKCDKTCNKETTINDRYIWILKIISKIYSLIQSDSFSNKRDIYYEDVELYGRSQRAVDDAVNVISCITSIPRWNLNVFSTSKGLISGNLKFMPSPVSPSCLEPIDCSPFVHPKGVSIPIEISRLESIHTDVSVVLIIEKDATFQKLIDDGFLENHPNVLLITGKGMPDLNTRYLLNQLMRQYLDLLFFALIDGDVSGIEIMSIYKYGSKVLASDAEHLTIPCLKWLGLYPSEVNDLNLPNFVRQKNSITDIRKIRHLLKRPFIEYENQWRNELHFMLNFGFKIEIECLASCTDAQIKEEDFLSTTYISLKLKKMMKKTRLEED